MLKDDGLSVSVWFACIICFGMLFCAWMFFFPTPKPILSLIIILMFH